MTDGTPTTHAATVVLVHGAFADGSSWSGVIERLRAKAVPVTAPPNPLRGISADSAYIASVFAQIDGPVLAVGHSYGGAVITNAATEAPNVVGLVYVAAFAPDEGEVLGAVEASSKDSVLNSALVPRQYPTADGGSATEFAIDPAKFRDAFAGDVSEEQAGLIAAVQRPVAEPHSPSLPGRPRGSTSPSWAVVATGDRAAGTDVVRSMASTRAHDHRGRRLARGHDLPARGRDRRDHQGDRGSVPRSASDDGRDADAVESAASSGRSGRSRPACSTSATSMPARPTAGPSCCFTAGRTTSTASPRSRRC